jgi:cell division protein FtsB
VSRFRPYLPTAFLCLMILYFGVQALTGERGLLNEEKRERTLAQRQSELATLTRQRGELEQRVRLLSSDHLSADLLEERARVLLGFADPRDFILRTPEGRREAS